MPATTDLIWGRYEPLEVVGSGGQGEVVRAFDHQHRRVVALKVRRLRAEDDRETILAEARILLGIRPHPGVSLVRDDFFVEDRYYLAMDWVEGETLGRASRERGPLEPGLVVRSLTEVAAALDHLHAHDPPVVHCDVKPENLILTPDGRVILVDFGISSHPDLTRAGAVGTRGFAAPELGSGARPSPSVDVYGLAATAFALLTGRPPSPEAVAASSHALPAAVMAPLRRALSTEPARRQRSAGALLDELRAALGLEPAAETGGRAARAASRPRRAAWRRRVAVAAALVMLAAATNGRPSVSAPKHLGAPPTSSGEPAPTIVATPPRSSPSSPRATAGSPKPSASPTASSGAQPGLSVPKPGSYSYQFTGWEQLEGSEDCRRGLSSSIPVKVTLQGTNGAKLEYADGNWHTESQVLDFADPAGVTVGSQTIHVMLRTLCPGERTVNQRTLDSDVRYSPELLLIPYPARPGEKFESSSNAVYPTGGQRRLETYSAEVRGTERMYAGGESLDTVVVRWRTDFRGHETGYRDFTFWFSPERGMILRWIEDTRWRFSDTRGTATMILHAEARLLSFPR